MANLAELFQFGKRELKENDIVDAEVDAWELMEYVFDIDRSEYYMNPMVQAKPQQEESYRYLIRKRVEHTPLQYLTGYAYFMGLKLKVNEHVLVPRFDTEVLVEQVLKLMKGNEKILDMCTGSGCILLSLLNECKQVAGTGADISESALEVAKENGAKLGITAEFIHSDLFSHISEKYDIIVSNPPYIATEVIQGLDEEVQLHEPSLALDGKEDGLYFYRKIVAESWEYLNPGGFLCFEIGFDQGDAVSLMMQDAGYENVEVVKDLCGLDRVVTGGKHV